MAVIVKYIVVRNGDEKMTFATKKEADAYDKMLDIADNMFEFLDNSKIKLSEGQLDSISLLLAEKREKIIPILRGVKPKKTTAKKTPPKETGTKKAPVKKPEKKENPSKKSGAKK